MRDQELVERVIELLVDPRLGEYTRTVLESSIVTVLPVVTAMTYRALLEYVIQDAERANVENGHFEPSTVGFRQGYRSVLQRVCELLQIEMREVENEAISRLAVRRGGHVVAGG